MPAGIGSNFELQLTWKPWRGRSGLNSRPRTNMCIISLFSCPLMPPAGGQHCLRGTAKDPRSDDDDDIVVAMTKTEEGGKQKGTNRDYYYAGTVAAVLLRCGSLLWVISYSRVCRFPRSRSPSDAKAIWYHF